MPTFLGRWKKQDVKAPSDAVGGAAGAPPLRGRANHSAVVLEESQQPTSRVVVLGGREQSAAGPEKVAAATYLMDVNEAVQKGYCPTLLDAPADLGADNEVGEIPAAVASGSSIFIAGGRAPGGQSRRALSRCDIKGSKAEWHNVHIPTRGGVFGNDERLMLAGHAVARVRAQGADWIYTFGGETEDAQGSTALTADVFRRRVGDADAGFELFRTGNMIPCPRRDAAMVHLPIGTDHGSGYLLLWGGRGGKGIRHPDGDVHILSIDDRSWYTIEVADDPAMAEMEGVPGRPPCSFGHTLTLIGQHILLVGGADTAESEGAMTVCNPLSSLWMLRFDEHGGLRWLREGEHFRMQKDDEAQCALEGGRMFHSTCLVRARQGGADAEQNCLVLVGGINQSADITGQGHVMLLWLNDTGSPGRSLPDPDLKRVKQSVFCAGFNAGHMCQCAVM